MKKFEYTIADCPQSEDLLSFLNELGRQGWELVEHGDHALPDVKLPSSQRVMHRFFMKREIDESANPSAAAGENSAPQEGEAVIGLLPIIAAGATQSGSIAAAFEADLTIETVSAEHGAPNPSAKLDVPDGTANKLDPPGSTGGANNGTEKPAPSGDPPTPKFNLSAYNGGFMRPDGFRLPVVLDGATAQAASDLIPFYVGHAKDTASTRDRLDQLFGQGSVVINRRTGEISASGLVTGDSALVKGALSHDKKGFKWQASVYGPAKLDYVPPGATIVCNGRAFSGPCIRASNCLISHIALVELGGDTTTSARIAASAALGKVMDFQVWLMAEFGMKPEQLNAETKPKFEAKFATICAQAENAGSGGGAATAVIDQPGKTGVVAAGADIESTITQHNTKLADNLERVGKIQIIAEGHATICAQAIREGWDAQRTKDAVETAVIRAERDAFKKGSWGGGQAPGIVSAAADSLKKEPMPYMDMAVERGGRYMVNGGPTDDGMCRAIEAAGLISAGRNISGESWGESLAKSRQYGERCVGYAEAMLKKFGSGLGPMGFIRLAASFSGLPIMLSHNNKVAFDELKSATISADFTTFTLPTILSNLQNKFLLDGFTSVDPDYGADAGGVAWQKFVKRGPCNDFKPQYRNRLVGNQRPLALGPGGEIEHGQLGELSYIVQAKVKALMHGIPYTAIVDDDQSAFSTLPTHCGVGCGEQVAIDIYSTIKANLQSDGLTAFFTASDSLTAAAIQALKAFAHNLIATNGMGSSPSTAFLAMETAFQQFANQVKPNGAPLGIMPALGLYPVNLRGVAMQLYESTDLIPALAASTTALRGQPSKNIYEGMCKPVVSQWLGNSSVPNYVSSDTTTWFLAGPSTGVAYPMEAVFLNGQEMPIIERDEMSFDRLGIGFRWWLSYGVAMSEPRAMIKNTA